jgi:hypothetical protein
MSLDSHVKDALERSSMIVDPDVRRDLVTVRWSAHRALVIRRAANTMLVAGLVIAAVLLAPQVLDVIKDRSQQPAGPNPFPGHPLIGTWTQEQSCGDFVRALTEYGLADDVPSLLVANGYRAGPKSKVAAQADPCQGSGPPVRRTWSFDGTTLRGFLNGHRVDLAIPQSLDSQSIRVSHINLGFSIASDTLRFIVPQLPKSCTGPDCLSQHAWAVAAFGLGPWHRVA